MAWFLFLLNMQHPIGVFDSGYGGLTVLKEMAALLPHYDFLYMGDNARAPYGNRSFETVYQYTWQAVQWFFEQGCPLVILACNTASAKALRTIQQTNLPIFAPDKRVLGVIRPTSEIIGNYTKTKSVGVLATNGTVLSESYIIEINKFFPDIKVTQQACPMWVPLIENNEYQNSGADYFIKKDIESLLKKAPEADTFLLACTHYPLLMQKIEKLLPGGTTLLSQGSIVSKSLADYLKRHPEIDHLLTKNATRNFYTTDSAADFNKHAAIFYGQKINADHIDLP